LGGGAKGFFHKRALPPSPKTPAPNPLQGVRGGEGQGEG